MKLLHGNLPHCKYISGLAVYYLLWGARLMGREALTGTAWVGIGVNISMGEAWVRPRCEHQHG